MWNATGKGSEIPVDSITNASTAFVTPIRSFLVQVVAQGAANTDVRHFDQLFAGPREISVAFTHKGGVDVYLAHVIDVHSNLTPLPIAQDVIQEGGFTGARKPERTVTGRRLSITNTSFTSRRLPGKICYVITYQLNIVAVKRRNGSASPPGAKTRMEAECMPEDLEQMKIPYHFVRFSGRRKIDAARRTGCACGLRRHGPHNQ